MTMSRLSEIDAAKIVLLPASTSASYYSGAARGSLEAISRVPSGSDSYAATDYHSQVEENKELALLEEELEERRRKLDHWEEDLNRRMNELKSEEQDLAIREKEVDAAFEKLKASARGAEASEASILSGVLALLQARVEALEIIFQEQSEHQLSDAEAPSESELDEDGRPLLRDFRASPISSRALS